MLHFQFDENFDQPIKINSQPTAPNVYKWEIVRKHLSLPLSHSRHSNRKLKNVNNSTKTQMCHAMLKISYKNFAQTNIVSWCSRNSRILLHINYCFVLVLRGWWLTIVQLKSTPEIIISFRAKFFSLSISDIQRNRLRNFEFLPLHSDSVEPTFTRSLRGNRIPQIIWTFAWINFKTVAEGQ